MKNETQTRAASGLLYIVLLIGATLFSTISFTFLFAVFMVIAVYEFSKLVEINIYFSLVFAILIFTIFQLSTFKSLNVLLIFTILTSIWLLFELFYPHEISQNNILKKYFFLLGYAIFPFIILLKTPFLNTVFTPQIIIGIFILIWTNDTFAYLVGKTIGKHKLFERISPKKTIEGFLGGLLFTSIAGYIIQHYFSFFSTTLWMQIAVLVTVFGTLGDLIESRFKRMAGVKDSGNIMPGHGGILDRLDSIIFAIPFIFLLLNYVFF